MAAVSVNSWESDLIDLFPRSLSRPGSHKTDISADLCYSDSLRDRVYEPILLVRRHYSPTTGPSVGSNSNEGT